MQRQLDVKVAQKEHVKSIGVKRKRRESDPSIEEDCPRPDVMDFISKMPDDILVNILSRLPLKQAVTTSILSPKWRFVWCSLNKLDFIGSTTLAKMNEELCDLERAKYINQVNNVIGSLRSHNSPMVQSFKICCYLDEKCFKDIDNWLRFALEKKVELLELDLCEDTLRARCGNINHYEFPLPLTNGKMVNLSEYLSSSSMVIESLPFKKVTLLSVDVSDITLKLLLKNSPHLEILRIHGSYWLTDVDVGGRDINMKHFQLTGCEEVESVSLHDFDLEKFHYFGENIDMRLTNLPKLKKVTIGEVSVGLKNKVFGAISSVASNLEVLNLIIERKKEDLNVEAIPGLPNVKKLKLTIPTEESDSLIAFLEIAKKCPKLEFFRVWLYWSSLITRNKTSCAAIDHSFSHLKHLEIRGYRGIVSDIQIAMYMIGNASDTLKKIVIDPSTPPPDKSELTAEECLKREEAGRSHAKSMLSQCLPSVELVIL